MYGDKAVRITFTLLWSTFSPRVSRVLFEGKPKEGDLLVGHRVKQRLNDTVSEPPLLELVHLNYLQMEDSG